MPTSISISGACVALAITAGLALVAVVFRDRRQKIGTAHLRGRSLRTVREAHALLEQCRPTDDPGLQLGRLRVPSECAYSHLALVGATGSGKTLLQRLLMQSVLPRIGEGFGHRALIYDAKQDVLSVLAGMKLSCPIRTLNPLDARAVAWDMAADITGPASAFQVASLLIPETKGDSNPFFASAARHLLYGTLVAFIQKPGARWTFRELLLTLRETSRLQHHLERCEATRWVIGGSQDKPGLAPGATNAFHFVIASDKPFTTTNLSTKVNFSRLVLDGGRLADLTKDVRIEHRGE